MAQRVSHRVALVVSRETEEEERPKKRCNPELQAALIKLGFDVVICNWDDPAVEWREFRLCVIRTRSFNHLSQAIRLSFFEWVERVAEAGVHVVNNPKLLRWNWNRNHLKDGSLEGVRTLATAPDSLSVLISPRMSRTIYLRDVRICALQSRDTACPDITIQVPHVEVIPTKLLTQRDYVPLDQCLQDTLTFANSNSPNNAIVIKPVLRAATDHTKRFCFGRYDGQKPQSNVQEAHRHIDACLLNGDILLQPYVSAVERCGVISVISFKGKVSHAVRRMPAPNEYRYALAMPQVGDVLPVNPISLCADHDESTRS
eukprot:1033618-Pyramimonas_sp.AAC.1